MANNTRKNKTNVSGGQSPALVSVDPSARVAPLAPTANAIANATANSATANSAPANSAPANSAPANATANSATANATANSANTNKKTGGRKTVKKSGKRKLSGYMKFTMTERKKLPKTMKFTEQGKELGKRWRALSDAEKKKF